MNEEKRAQRINASLEHGDLGKANKEDWPYLRMAAALNTDALDKEAMDSGVMKSQKQHLLQMAKNIKEESMNAAKRTTNSEQRTTKSGRWYQKGWYVWAGGLTAVAAAVLLVFVSTTGPFPFQNAERAAAPFGKATLSLMIPAVHAADAFSILVDKGDESNAAVDTSLVVQSKVDVSTNDLKQSLRIIPADSPNDVSIDFDIEKGDEGSYVIKPKGDLQPGEVYKVTIAAAVEEDGETKPREFSWAIQTQNVFRVLRSVPDNRATYVPVNSAIEIVLSQVDWEDPDNYFSMEPATPGRFETHGRSLVYVPEKPLKNDTIYTVIYKQGWGVKNGQKLKNDVVIKFETESEKEKTVEEYFNIADKTAESSIGSETLVAVYRSDRITSANVMGYKISKQEALNAVMEYEKIPYWAYRSRERSDAFAKYAKEQAFSFESGLETINYSDYVRIPNNIEEGYYAVKIVSNVGLTDWLLLQRTNTSAYTMVDRDKILVWATNKDTFKSLTDAKVEMDGKVYNADAQGLISIPTPQRWRDFIDSPAYDWEAEIPLNYLQISSAAGDLLMALKYEPRYWGMGTDAGNRGQLDYWSYIFADRPLYRTMDEIGFFGLAKIRESGKTAGDVRVELSSYLDDLGTYEHKVMASADIKADEKGFYEGKLKWKSPIKAGYYHLKLKKGGDELVSRQVEIRDVIKPAYTISVVPEVQSIYAGDNVKGKIKVAFFDGTPLVNTKVDLTADGGFGGQKSLEVVTDDAGYADFEFKTEKPICDLNADYSYCGISEFFSILARSDLGEEAEIFGTADIRVWRGRMVLESAVISAVENKAQIEYEAREIDLNKRGLSDEDIFGSGLKGLSIKANVFEEHWDQIETGTRYDPVEKTTYPTYRYERRLEKAGEYQVTTDASGKAILNFEMKNDVTYKIIASATDSRGVVHAAVKYVSDSWYAAGDDEELSLELAVEDKDKADFSLNEKVAVRFVKGGKPMANDNASFMYIRASRGIQSVQVSQDSYYSFNYSEKDIPNAVIFGIAFTKTGFKETMHSIAYKSTDKKLNLELKTDKDFYAPGGQVDIRISAKDADGNAVKDAVVAFSVVDEALLAAANLSMDENPLGILYRWVPDGILQSVWSHEAEDEFDGGGGGAEFGGWDGSGGVRSNFKDQAAFMVVRTDSGGNANATIGVPDNITSWRITAAAITEDLRAGGNSVSIGVTKPLFVDAVIPKYLLSSDKPVIKLRAHGLGLPQSGDISYEVDIPTLGINKQKVAGKALEPVYVAIDQLIKGKHAAVIRLSANNQTDAVLRYLDVADSRLTHDERVVVELGPGTALPEAGVSTDVTVAFESKAKAQMRYKVESLAHPWSARAEAALAGVMMRNLMIDYYGANESDFGEMRRDLLAYQRPDGGIAILPYASSEAELSARVAAVYADAFDKTELANYFWEIVDDKEVSREEAIDALSGLAALGQPVLDRLQIASQQDDLSWRERLALMRGFAAAGNREGAQSLLQSFLDNAEVTDNQMRLKISEDVTEEIEATVISAALAASLAHPDAEKLMNYVESVWNHEAMTDLDKAHYLQAIVPILPDVNVKIEYALGADVKTIDLSENPVVYVNLTADELRQFRVTSVNGPAAASFVRRVEGEARANSDLVGLNREYSVDGKNTQQFKEGDIVTVTLSPKWNPKAQDGCYMVRDRLPATMMPLFHVTFDPWTQDYLSYPYDVSGGEASFVLCKSVEFWPIIYKARVVALGDYTAPGALMQSMNAPEQSYATEAIPVQVK